MKNAKKLRFSQNPLREQRFFIKIKEKSCKTS